MQNAGQYVPGAANAHQTQQFAPSEPSPNGGSTTSSLRQFRKRDVDKTQLEQPPKQESHVARVAPHNHYPPASNDLYRYPTHQFSEYSPQVKYSDIADASQQNPISTSVIQKPKPKDYMEMCNVQQQHMNNQQQYSPDNGQYMHRDPSQGFPPSTHYLPKDQHQYQQLGHHPSQPKFNTMMTQNMSKYNPGHADNPFLNKLRKIHPSMARSIMSDHHALQEPQPSFSPMDQRAMYAQQNHRFYTASSMQQPNPYAPNPNYPMNPSHHYPNYASASCSFPRTPTMPQRYPHMERSMSPTRRGYSENIPMNHLQYHNMHQKMPTAHNYNPQYNATPEYAQHYQHRRMAADYYPQPGRPTQYLQNHHQMPAQEMQELSESRISPSDSLKKFIENWAADEEPANEINPMESNMNLRDNIKIRDDAPPGTVYMINATDMENYGIPIVTSDNGGIQLTSENYQYLLKNGLVDNSGMVRIIEANKDVSIGPNGNPERVVNLQIMEAPKSDCMMNNKSMHLNDGIAPNGMSSKPDNETRRVVIHQNTVITPGNSVTNDGIPNHQSVNQASIGDQIVESISISKELVDKNCSPINLDQLEHNLGFSEPEPSETENIKNNSVPGNSTDPLINGNENKSSFKDSEIGLTDALSQHSNESENQSPGSKSMPIIDLFGESHVEENDSGDLHNNIGDKSQNEAKTAVGNDKKSVTNQEMESLTNSELSLKQENKDVKDSPFTKEICSLKDNEAVLSPTESQLKNKLGLENSVEDPLISSPCKSNSNSNNFKNSVIVSPETIKKEDSQNEDKNWLENTDLKNILETENSSELSKLSIIKCKKELDEEIKHTEDNPNLDQHTDKNNQENQSTPINRKTPSPEVAPTSLQRRKRIFSVDDIIHHIGNNLKRGSKELDSFCSSETLTNFIEKEVEFSSLEQISTLNTKNNPEQITKSVSLDATTHNTTNEGEDSSCTFQDPSSFKTADESTMLDLSPKIKEVRDPESSRIISTELESKTDESVTEIESKTDESVTEIESKSKFKSDNLVSENSTQASSSTISVQVQQESDDRTDTPNNFQYRNALRVDETSVLLQIAGELMEISVNIVNGKKVITVLPLSETTVVDYNDNYEVSSNVQDIVQLNESGQLDDSGIETEQLEDAQQERDEQIEKTTCDEGINHLDRDILIRQQLEAGDGTSKNIQDIEMHEDPMKIDENNEHYSKIESAPVLTKTQTNILTNELQFVNKDTNLDNNLLSENNICQEAKPNNLNKSNNEVEIEIKNNSCLLHPVFETTKTDTNEIKTNFQSDKISENSECIETKKNEEEEYVINEGLKTTETSNVQIIEGEHLLQTSQIEEKVQKTIDNNNLENVCLNNYTITDDMDADNNLNRSKDFIEKSVNEENKTIEDLLETEKIENKLKKNEIFQSVGNECTITDNERSPVTNIDACEQDETDTDIDQLEYQLEDDVFISEEPPHEIIVSDPLDGVGLIEEIDKTSDSFDIPLERVTTSNESLNTEPPSFTEAMAVVEPKPDIAERDLFSALETNITETDNHTNQNKESLEITNTFANPNSPQPVTESNEGINVDELNLVSPTPRDFLIPKLEATKELVVKLSKPEIQILSPTSTNLDDHFATSKENVYLEPRRKYSTDNDVSESTATTIATKAAKKLYECDLQIPAVTTSGDVSHKSAKKTSKHRRDTVSSSEKKSRSKEPSRSKISSLKRSKRINDKIQTKNEQKEMLRLLAEKRKKRKEFQQKTDVASTEKKENPVKNNVEKEAKSSKQSTENDDEYVDFKELLQARKLRKLKKMQERKAFNENSSKTDKANKDTNINANISAKNKVDNESKLALVSTSQPVEKKTETKKECCVGCNYKVGKSNTSKDEKPKTSKRTISESNQYSSAEKPKNTKVTKIEIPTVTFDQNSGNLNLQTSIVTETKSTNLESDKKIVDNKSNSDKTADINTINSPAKFETNVSKQTSASCTDQDSAKENKTTRQKRVSFSSNVSIYDASSNNDKSANSSSKTKTHSLPKDPRRHSRSYSGQVMVPSVSELIEENCAPISKKKITLADYVSRKRKTSSDECGKSKTDDKEAVSKKYRYEKRESVESASSDYNTEESPKPLPKTVRDIKTSFVIHSSDWEDSQSPVPATVQSNDECLIQDFSGLMENCSKKPVIDVNELISVETPKNPKDKKLQEYKDKVDSQLSSLNIQIPNKVKAPSLENKPTNLTWDYGSPENNFLIKKFLSSEKITAVELEKIKKIISYKRLMQNQKNALSPSKSPMPTSSEYNQNLPHLNQEIIETPFSSGLAYSKNQLDQTYEIKNFGRLETDSKEKRLHLKKVNGKRKIQLESDEPNSSSVQPNQSEGRHKPNVDYSVFNRLGKDGLPKIIFKRNRQSNISDDNQPVVALERIDDKLDEVEEKYNVTVTQMM